MFEGLDMNALLAQAQQMQADMMAAQETAENTDYTGTAGGGLVSLVVSGTGELRSVEIKPEACDPEDTETLGDLIVAAFRDAKEQADDAARATMPQLPEGLGFQA